MHFTISAHTKVGKKLLKQAMKKAGKTSVLPKTIKYTTVELEAQLQELGKGLEQEKQPAIELTFTLYDTEGKIEKAGTEYMFGPLNYQVSEGFFPTLMDLIRQDIFKETDETMSVEESYRNEKLLQVLEEELETDQPKVNADQANEEVPWERPIFPKKESKEKGEDFVDEQADIPNQNSIFEEENEVMDQLEVDPFEETVGETTEVEIDPVEANEEPTWTEEDSQAYIEPFISEEMGQKEAEIQRVTLFESILDQYPPAYEWLKEKNKLFLNELYTKYQLPQTYQAFLDSKEELISEGRGILLEQLESVQSINWHDLAQEELLSVFEERQQETNQEINEYAAEQSSNWEKTKAELDQEEQRVIEEEVKKIKERYEKKRDNAYSLCVEKINQFTKTNQEALSKEKETQLNECMGERKKEYYQGLRTDKLKISKDLNERLNQLVQTTTGILNEIHEQIQKELQGQLLTWKKEYEILQKKQEEQADKERQEAQKREQLEVKKREQDLAEQKIAIEKQRLEQEKEKEVAARKERQEQMDTLRQAQLNYLAQTQPTPSVAAIQPQVNLAPAPQRSFNGWMVGCVASLSLLLGGGTVFAFNHISQSSQTDSAATVASVKEVAQEQARKEYEQQLEELFDRTNSSTTDSSVESTQESHSSQSKEEPSVSSQAQEKSSASTVPATTTESSDANEVK
ncbi:hypothetical protein HFX73_002417 [Enterococcus faecium]|nr:hypothetical protein [Enterococcus faecium]